MGIMYVEAVVRRPDGRGHGIEVRLLVDTGALYSVLPEDVWKALHLEPMDVAEFSLADGSLITRPVSECRFELRKKRATSPVVLGEAGEGPLLGAVTLETMGLMLNPLTREIRAMRLMLAGVGGPTSLDSPRSPAPS